MAFHYLPIITLKLFPEFLVQNIIQVNNHTTNPTELKCLYRLTIPLSRGALCHSRICWNAHVTLWWSLCQAPWYIGWKVRLTSQNCLCSGLGSLPCFLSNLRVFTHPPCASASSSVKSGVSSSTCFMGQWLSSEIVGAQNLLQCLAELKNRAIPVSEAQLNSKRQN